MPGEQCGEAELWRNRLPAYMFSFPREGGILANDPFTRDEACRAQRLSAAQLLFQGEPQTFQFFTLP